MHDAEAQERKAWRTANEESVAGKDSPVVAVLHEVADAVPSVARRVHARYRNVTQFKRFSMLGSICHTLAILSADNLQFGHSQLFHLSRCGQFHPVS